MSNETCPGCGCDLNTNKECVGCGYSRPTIMDPQHLTLKDVVIAGRKAYNEGRLQAQMPERAWTCRYTSTDTLSVEYNCIIGAALTQHIKKCLLEEGANVAGVGTLVSDQYIVVPHGELLLLKGLQKYHDDWAHNQTKEYEDRFLALLSNHEKDLGITNERSHN